MLLDTTLLVVHIPEGQSHCSSPPRRHQLEPLSRRGRPAGLVSEHLALNARSTSGGTRRRGVTSGDMCERNKEYSRTGLPGRVRAHSCFSRLPCCSN